MKKSEAIKKYFGSEGYPTVTLAEMKAFMVADKDGYDWCATEAAKELGETID